MKDVFLDMPIHYKRGPSSSIIKKGRKSYKFTLQDQLLTFQELGSSLIESLNYCFSHSLSFGHCLGNSLLNDGLFDFDVYSPLEPLQPFLPLLPLLRVRCR